MYIHFSADYNAQSQQQNIIDISKQISIDNMQSTIQQIEGPRHYSFNPHHNHYVREWIATQLSNYGYDVYMQGKYNNVVALPTACDSSVTVVAAHYDSIAETPGADDNGSAVAVMLECARVVAQEKLPIGFIAFNCEEDGLLGSYDFVKNLQTFPRQIHNIHVLEMLGYCSNEPGSQRIPAGIPVQQIDIGNFVAIVGDTQSKKLLENALSCIATYGQLLGVGAQATSISTKLLHILKRSDHFPFWQVKIPALMWTDTAEYRNPHYHKSSDTIETLDFEFMRNVTEVLIACLLENKSLD